MTGRYRSVFAPELFRGETFLVTGGGSGIGRCTAHELSALGATVALVGRRADHLESVRAELAEVGGAATTHMCDIREEEQVRMCVAGILAEHGRIDGLVNNAGGQFSAPLEAISQKGWETVVRTNLTGGFLMAREVYSQSMHKAGGRIVNIIADMWNSMPLMGHSGAARAGMLNLTQTAAIEWAHRGVRVNAVAPGWIASSGFDTYDPETTARIRSLAQAGPLKRFGNEAEVSAAIVFLMTPAASFISGSCIRVDGAVPNLKPGYSPPDHTTSRAYEGFHLAKAPRMMDAASDETQQ